MSETDSPQAAPTPFWRVETWFPELGESILKNLKIYHDEIIKYNRSIDLISPKTVVLADAIHFADSILAARIIYRDNPGLTEIVDIGSGNGFPGIVMGLMFPKLKVRLVESDAKRCDFMRHMVSVLKVGNVEVVHKAVEALEANSVKVCVERGFFTISKSILLTRKQVVKGGVFYHVKQDSWPAEVADIPTQLCSVWAPALVAEYKLPISPLKFAVIKTEKIA